MRVEVPLSTKAAITPAYLETLSVELVVPQKRAHGTLALVGARIITMRGEEVIGNGTAILKDGRIQELGAKDRVLIPDGAKVLDSSGKTMIPGLIDAHAHFNETQRDLLAKNEWESLVSLAYGITTIKNPSNGGDHAFSYAELVDSGQMIVPRSFSTPGLVGGWTHSVKSIHDAIDIENRYKQLGAIFTKYHTAFNRTQRKWIIEAARESGLRVSAHLPSTVTATGRLDLSTVVDGATSSEHEISESSDLFNDVRFFLRQSKVGVCFTPIANNGGYPSYFWNRLKDDVRLKKFYRGQVPAVAGFEVTETFDEPLPPLLPAADRNAKFISGLDENQILIGSHGNFDGVGMHLEMWAHVRGGMTPHQVLKAVTINGARSLGLDDQLGSPEAGKIADLIILDKNPLADIRNSLSVVTIVQGGVVRRADSLEEIWPLTEPLPEWDRHGTKSPLVALP